MSPSKVENACHLFSQQLFTEYLLVSGHCFNVKDAAENKLNEASAVLEIPLSGGRLKNKYIENKQKYKCLRALLGM